MKSYKTHSTVQSSGQVILSDVPFNIGEEVDIVMVPSVKDRDEGYVADLKKLLKITQSLPNIRKLSEDEIVREIELFRNGK